MTVLENDDARTAGLRRFGGQRSYSEMAHGQVDLSLYYMQAREVRREAREARERARRASRTSRASRISRNSRTSSLRSRGHVPGGHDPIDPIVNTPAAEAEEEKTEEEDSDSDDGKERGCGPWVKRKARGACTRDNLTRRIPPLRWLPAYSADDAVGDLVAGITVGLTVIPQALAYARVAELPPEYGLYGSFIGCFVYIVLGSCKDSPMGPSAISALLTAQAVKGNGWEHAVLLCFAAGIIQVAMACLGLGFVIDFISGPVSSGFTSAAALIIFTSQVKDLLGIDASGSTFVTNWIDLVRNMGATRAGDAGLACACIVVLLLMRLLVKVRLSPEEAKQATPLRLWATRALWLLGTARNAVLLIVCAVVGARLHARNPDEPAVRLIGDIPAGLPTPAPPPFSANVNGTEYGFGEMLSNLGSGIAVVPLVGLLEDIAVAKAFANGRAVDATQELLAIGVSNVANSFFQGFPGTGALSRGAVNNSSGVRTPLGGLYTGLLVIVALLFFTPYFAYVPRASLAAIIVAAVVFMVEVHVVVPMWRAKKSDLVPCLGTFIACLVLRLEQGILVGIGLSVLFVLYHIARPKIAVDTPRTAGGVEYLKLTPDRCLVFPAVDYVRNLVTKHSLRLGAPVVIDCSHVYQADFTAAKVMECLAQDFAVRRQPLFFFRLKESLRAMLEALQPRAFVVFSDMKELDDLIKAHEKVAAVEAAVEAAEAGSGADVALRRGVGELCKESAGVATVTSRVAAPGL